MSITRQGLQNLPDELDASRASRGPAWENLREIRWAVKDSAGMDLPPPAKTQEAGAYLGVSAETVRRIMPSEGDSFVSDDARLSLHAGRPA
ncbi:MAG: hypothetical protein JO334_04905 [Verrucomicrobia bacterium]|nr:hypothetical protein [Verrucomicrobiota bacterium]